MYGIGDRVDSNALISLLIAVLKVYCLLAVYITWFRAKFKEIASSTWNRKSWQARRSMDFVTDVINGREGMAWEGLLRLHLLTAGLTFHLHEIVRKQTQVAAMTQALADSTLTDEWFIRSYCEARPRHDGRKHSVHEY